MTERLRIERLGAGGDGVARSGADAVFASFALPGELVEGNRQKDRLDVRAVLEASPLRVAPLCRHFGTCGGCSLQHMDEGAYREWKRERVIAALRAEGIEAEVAPLVPCQPRSRRRVALSARRVGEGVVLGFNRMHSHEIVDIAENWIALPAIVSALDRLRGLCRLLARTPKPFRLLVTATDSGLDVAAEGSGRLAEADRRAAGDFTIRAGYARLSVDREIVVEPRKPSVTFGGAAVAIPPGAFLQAVAETEAAMASLVAAHLQGAKRIGDLFAGCGAFGLRLARHAAVHAVESDAQAVAALDQGGRRSSGLKPVTTERRDLFRRPLTTKELGLYDGICFDPPRAGAESQCLELARSNVPRIAAVSCNPATLARDLKLLLAGGYRLVSVTPFDQFLWSSHVEAVALLEKAQPRRR